GGAAYLADYLALGPGPHKLDPIVEARSRHLRTQIDLPFARADDATGEFAASLRQDGAGRYQVGKPLLLDQPPHAQDHRRAVEGRAEGEAVEVQPGVNAPDAGGRGAEGLARGV